MKGYQISGKGSYRQLLPASLFLPTNMASHLISNWNPFLTWLGEINLLKETLPKEVLDAANSHIQADLPVSS